MKFLIVIPARYDSSRFPGKLVENLGGKPVILHVCERVSLTGVPFVVATDSYKISEIVDNAGYISVMTSSCHKSGTERVEEAVSHLKSDAEVIINVQGDEPFIDPKQILELSDIFLHYPETDIATLARIFPIGGNFVELENPNLVKLTVDNNSNALYFSRSVIPHLRNVNQSNVTIQPDYLTHIGIYAYKSEILKELVVLPESSLEKAEKLEQLRWLQNGYRIKVGISNYENIGIDTPQDLIMAERALLRQTKNQILNFH